MVTYSALQPHLQLVNGLPHDFAGKGVLNVLDGYDTRNYTVSQKGAYIALSILGGFANKLSILYPTDVYQI